MPPRSFLGVSGHWITESLERKNIALAIRRMRGSNTYDKLATALTDIMQELGIQNKVSAAITDSGTNFCNSFDLFGEELGGGEIPSFDDEDEEMVEAEAEEITEVMSRGDDNGLLDIYLPPHFRCASHRLNNIATTDVEAANEDLEFNRKSRSAHAKCTALLNKQGHSSQISDLVRDTCGKLFERPNDTRWNSHWRSMNGIKTEIEKSDDNLNGLMDKLGLPWFTDENIKFINEYCTVFEPFAAILDILQGEKTALLACFSPCWHI